VTAGRSRSRRVAAAAVKSPTRARAGQRLAGLRGAWQADGWRGMRGARSVVRPGSSPGRPSGGSARRSSASSRTSAATSTGWRSANWSSPVHVQRRYLPAPPGRCDDQLRRRRHVLKRALAKVLLKQAMSNQSAGGQGEAAVSEAGDVDGGPGHFHRQDEDAPGLGSARARDDVQVGSVRPAEAQAQRLVDRHLDEPRQ
jgi:hypothetical protein